MKGVKLYFLAQFSFLFIAVCFATTVMSQMTMPTALSGTWKVSGKSEYEHWDILNPGSMRGMVYINQGGELKIKEYLRIDLEGDKIFYGATVVRQNQGNEVKFRMTRKDSVVVFENPEHDFPKRIAYTMRGADALGVHVSDGGTKGFSYVLERAKIEESAKQGEEVVTYDGELAEKLGADDYGMKQYYFVLLKSGTASTDDKEAMGAAFRGHMDNMQRLSKEGALIVAGPFGTNTLFFRGLFILSAPSLESAAAMVGTDPAVAQGYLSPEIIPWYGSAALPVYLDTVDKITKKRF